MAKDKALIYELGTSISFGRLSLLGKVVWPMLLIKADDQGRGLAEPDWIKWRVCPNVEELTIENIGAVLDEMASERIGLLHLYQDKRKRRLFQIVRWWEPELGSGSTRQWAAPSEFEPPDGWTDRVRANQSKELGGYTESNWGSCGGFDTQPRPVPTKAPDDIGTEIPTPVPTPLATPVPGAMDCNGLDCNGLDCNDQASSKSNAPSGAVVAAALLLPELLALGLDEQTAQECANAPPAIVRGWLDHIVERGDKLQNPAGLLVSRVRKRAPPPRQPLPKRDPYQEFYQT